MAHIFAPHVAREDFDRMCEEFLTLVYVRGIRPKHVNSGLERGIALSNEVARFRLDYNIRLNTPAFIE